MCDSATEKRGVYEGEVAANELLCRKHWRLRLRVTALPPSRPGQFVQLQCRPIREQVSAREVEWADGQLPQFTQPELTDKEPLLRRPLSIGGRRDTGATAELDLIYRAVGTGTTWLSGVRAGDRLSVIGPLGNAFPVSQHKPRAALVGGGVGIPPMLCLADAIGRGKQATAFCGVRSQHLLPLTLTGKPDADGRPGACAEEFARSGATTVVASDDGTVGYEGLVTDALLHWLRAEAVPADDLVVYACGPEPMMRAAADLCIELGIECYVSLERIMACGMGTCQSCVVKIRDDSRQGWAYKLCCSDGPVFPADAVVW
ncbi:MAG: dihydroorotate dehydrogenase electron transfer subunit [Planctomycetes bacterium]|jgi:dihydroorotate dehydrogenase electron transfer subunit|nr:dihydroorotate dehydrogenase electron transfer subunit [Phycisphaerae bacterium]NBB94645.1 dihydroorotate dehydrogenase electron transfer subunit [Planctomycetota bacterium]